MPSKTNQGKPAGATVAEELDTLNAQVRAARNAPNRLRRAMELRIEAKAKRRREGQAPASAGLKGVPGAK